MQTGRTARCSGSAVHSVEVHQAAGEVVRAALEISAGRRADESGTDAERSV